MSFNPPESREEIRDTLFCLGVTYEYEKVSTPKGHVYSFYLPDIDTYLDIYGPRFVRINKLTVRSLYDAKQWLMRKFQDRI